MKIEQLVAKQQLAIENLKEENDALYSVLRNIRQEMVCIGGPLNDNKHGYNKEQLQIFCRFLRWIEEHEEHEGPMDDYFRGRNENYRI